MVQRDLRIEIPEALLSENAYDAEATEIINLTEDIKRLRLTILNPAGLHFRPGQYIQLKSNPYGNVTSSVMRSYSIASPKQSTHRIDLMVRLIPEGICSTWIHRHLKVGDRILFAGPRGDFTLRDGQEDIVMVAGGSGMAPMVSMLHELADGHSNRSVDYFFGACSEKDLFYLDVMEAFHSRMPVFRFIPVLSQPVSPETCQSEIGLVTEPFEKYLRKRGPQSLHVYLCGSPIMVQKCRTIAQQAGVTPDAIFHDPFT